MSLWLVECVTVTHYRESIMKINSFLSSPNSMIIAFEEAVESATAIDIAVAWISNCKPVKILSKFVSNGGNLRVVVGRDFNGTDPDAIERLIEVDSSVVKWAQSSSGVFHPKLYIFYCGDEIRLIVGSANMTNAAFTVNVEVMYDVKCSIEEVGDVCSFFSTQWNDGTVVTRTNLAKYRVDYENDRKRVKHEIKIVDENNYGGIKHESNVVDVVSEEPNLFSGWKNYLSFLFGKAVYWESSLNNPPLLYGGRSWIDALRSVCPLLERSFENLSTVEKKALVGLESEDFPSAAYFGRNKGNGLAVKALTKSINQTQVEVEKALSELPSFPEELTIGKVKKSYERMRNIENLGSAIVTRYLTLKRPDYLISVNSASLEFYSEVFNKPKTRIKEWRGYGEILEILWNIPWMKSEQPENKFEQELWSFRAALLDVFAYRPSVY